MIVIGIPGLIAAKDFFLCSLKRIKYLWYDLRQYISFSLPYLLTKSFERSRCLRGCWSILTYWWSSIARKTCGDNVLTGIRELHKFSNFYYTVWTKNFCPFLQRKNKSWKKKNKTKQNKTKNEKCERSRKSRIYLYKLCNLT